MVNILDLFDKPESEWDRNIDVDLPPAKYVFRLDGHREKSDKGSLEMRFKAVQPLEGFAGEFIQSKYRPVFANFGEMSLPILKRFLKESGISDLSQTRRNLPMLHGKLYVGDVTHTPREGGGVFVNVRNLQAKDSYDKKAMEASGLVGGPAPEEEDDLVA